MTLFSRSKNGVFLTPIGEQIVVEAETILCHANTITKLVKRHKSMGMEALEGTLKIQLPPTVNNWLLSAILPDFQTAYPALLLDSIENNPEEILKLLATRDYDLHVFSTLNEHFEELTQTLAERHPGLTVEFLCACKQYVSISQDSPWAQKKSISLKELCTLPIGSLSYSFYDYDYMSRITDGVAKPNIIFKTNSLAVLTDQVRKGNCVSVSVAFQPRLEQIVLVPISNAVRLKFFGAYYADNEKTAAIHYFLELLKAQF